MPKPKITRAEGIRRCRLGDIRRLLRSRWGAILPDDSAGISDLEELLYPISLVRMAEKRMKAVIETMAPWLSDREACDMIYRILDMPRHERKPSAKALGIRMRLTNVERERHKLWTIRPVDMTAKQLADQRREKDRLRKQRTRKRMPREQHLKLVPKPWVLMKISRATYYRRRETGCVPDPSRANETGCVQTTRHSETGVSAAKNRGGQGQMESHRKTEGVSDENQRQGDSSQAQARTWEVSKTFRELTDTGFPDLPVFLDRRKQLH
jgi:hypothetical protein